MAFKILSYIYVAGHIFWGKLSELRELKLMTNSGGGGATENFAN